MRCLNSPAECSKTKNHNRHTAAASAAAAAAAVVGSICDNVWWILYCSLVLYSFVDSAIPKTRMNWIGVPGTWYSGRLRVAYLLVVV